jgi:transposase
LAAIVADRNRPRKHVERAGIVLASADRHSAQRVAHSIGVSRPTVWRWQQRFAESGVEGLFRDKTRKPGKAPIAAETTARVVALTGTAPPHQATHWTGRAMAKTIGISVGSVQRIWRAHKLQPHRLRTFKRSRHFTPTSASWLNAVENFFSKMTRQRIRRGVFHSIADLQAAINAYLAEHNASPKPFVWTQSAEAIMAKLERCPVPSV